jgi:hypothetical protein
MIVMEVMDSHDADPDVSLLREELLTNMHIQKLKKYRIQVRLLTN